MESTANGQSFSARTRDGLKAAKREATTPRLATVGALALGAAAFGLLRNPERRARWSQAMRDFSEKMSPMRESTRTPPTAA